MSTSEQLLAWRPYDDCGFYFVMVNESGIETGYKVRISDDGYRVYLLDELHATCSTVHAAMYKAETIYYKGGAA